MTEKLKVTDLHHPLQLLPEPDDFRPVPLDVPLRPGLQPAGRLVPAIRVLRQLRQPAARRASRRTTTAGRTGSDSSSDEERWKRRSRRSSSAPRAPALRRPRGASSTALCAGPTREFFERCDRWSAALQALGVAQGRSRRLHRAEHARAARVVLRRAADRRRARADQLPPDGRRLRVPHPAQRRDGRLRARRLPRRRRRHPRRSSPACGTSSRSRARATAGSTTRRSSPTRRADVRRPADRRARPAHHQLHQRHDLAAQGRDDHAPQRLDERRSARSCTCR